MQFTSNKKGILAGIELIMVFNKTKLIKLIYKAIFDQNQGVQNLTLQSLFEGLGKGFKPYECF